MTEKEFLTRDGRVWLIPLGLGKTQILPDHITEQRKKDRQKLKEVIDLVNSLCPCILMIDEHEKLIEERNSKNEND